MKTNRISILAVFAIAACLFAFSINNKLKFGGDAVEYLRLADSILHNHSYSIDGTFNSKWPPVTPMFFAAGQVLFGPSVAGFKTLSAVATLAGLWFAFLHLRKASNDVLALLAITLSALSLPLIYWLVDTSSECPFFLFSMLAIYLTSLLGTKINNHGWLLVAGVGLALGLTVLSRTIGLALLIAFTLSIVVDEFIRKRAWKLDPVMAMAVAGAIVGVWYIYSHYRSGQTSVSVYAGYDFFRDSIYEAPKDPLVFRVVKRAGQNLVGNLLIFALPDPVTKAKLGAGLLVRGGLSAIIMALAAWGFVWHFRHSRSFKEWYILVYGAVLLTPAWYDIRYIVPLFPILFYYVAFAMWELVPSSTLWRNRERLVRYATVSLLGLIIIGNLAISLASAPAKRLRSHHYYGPAAELYDAAQWIKQNDTNDIIMCRWSNMMWFWTRMKACGVPLIDDPEVMWAHIHNVGATIVIIDPDEFSGVTGKYLEPVLQAHPDKVELLNTFGRTRVFRLLP